MYQNWTMNTTVQQRAVAATVAGAVAGALATLFSSAPATAADTAGSTAAAITLPVALYSVINLGPDGSGGAVLNERGQAAFNAVNYFGVGNSFFDGDRITQIGTLGGTYATVRALNNLGVVVGNAEDAAQPNNVLGFTWTALGGMRALPGTSFASAEDVNDLGYSAGINSEPGIASRAVRWNPGGSIAALGPRPTSRAAAAAINQLNFAVGFSDDRNVSILPTLWDANGQATILGSLGGYFAYATHINARTDVAGAADNASHRQTGFFWSRLTGMVPIDSGSPQTVVADLNDRGEVVGYAQRSGAGLAAYKWTLTGGYTQLPSLSPAYTIASDINNAGDIVGTAQLPGGQGLTAQRAVRWTGLATPIDLNTRLYRAPAGLVVYEGTAINDAGVILATSNAGLVMLRPGTRGTDAPVLGPIVTLPRSIEVGQDLTLTVGFVDNALTQTHKANVVWTDGCTSPAPTVRELAGSGQVTLRHRFCAAGYQAVRLRVTDSGGRYTELTQDIAVYDPAQAAISGAGTLGTGPASVGSTTSATPLRFALWSPLGSATQRNSTGTADVLLSGPFHFRSEQVAGISREGQLARVNGTGRFNGSPGYRYTLEAQDGAPDRLRVRITHVDAATSTEVVDYDNAAPANLRAARPAPDLSTVVDGELTLRH